MLGGQQLWLPNRMYSTLFNLSAYSLIILKREKSVHSKHPLNFLIPWLRSLINFSHPGLLNFLGFESLWKSDQKYGLFVSHRNSQIEALTPSVTASGDGNSKDTANKIKGGQRGGALPQKGWCPYVLMGWDTVLTWHLLMRTEQEFGRLVSEERSSRQKQSLPTPRNKVWIPVPLMKWEAGSVPASGCLTRNTPKPLSSPMSWASQRVDRGVCSRAKR